MLIVFTIFLLPIVDEKIKLKVFSILLWNYLLILKMLPVSRFKDPKAAILTLKLLTRSRLWFSKMTPEAACDKLILAHFPCSRWEVGTWVHRPIKEKGILRKVSRFQSAFSKFQEISRSSSENLLKDLEKHQRMHRKYWLKCLDL